MTIRALSWPLLLAVLLLPLAGCAGAPAGPASTAPAPAAEQISATIGRWSELAGRRTFFTTVHAVGQRITASGVLDYRAPSDFRITTVTETGIVLFDVRYGPGGPTVARAMPGLSTAIVETLCRDIALAFRPPPDLAHLQMDRHDAHATTTSPEGYKYIYTFANPGARLVALDIHLGMFDTLHVEIPRYTVAGLPQEYVLRRPARSYEITLTFTEE